MDENQPEHERPRAGESSGAPKPAPSTPGGRKRAPISNGRIAIWLVVGAIGVYFVASGIYQLVTNGG